MKITCPECSTSYDIKANVVGTEGRSVKCARCGNRWFVSPLQDEEPEAPSAEIEAPTEPAAEESLADEEAWAEDAVSEADESEPDIPPGDGVEDAVAGVSPAEEAPVEDDDAAKTADIESMANRPKIKVNPNKFKRRRFKAIVAWLSRRNYRRMAGVSIFCFALLFVGLSIMLRDTIVKTAPDLASLFETVGLDVNLRGLEFRDLRTFQEVEEGKIVLVVEGSIRNVVAENTAVPAVHLSLRGEDHQEIYAWTFEPRTINLDGLDETRFRTRLEDPPENAVDIQVRFVERKIRQTSFE